MSTLEITNIFLSNHYKYDDWISLLLKLHPHGMKDETGTGKKLEVWDIHEAIVVYFFKVHFKYPA